MITTEPSSSTSTGLIKFSETKTDTYSIISNKFILMGGIIKELKSQLTCAAHLPGELGFFYAIN